jgi:hypothetical protein
MLEKGRLKTGEQLDYAFGLSVGEHRGLSFVGHAGGDAGYRSDMTRFPTSALRLPASAMWPRRIPVI